MNRLKLTLLVTTFLFVISAVISAGILRGNGIAAQIGGPHWEMGGVCLFGIALLMFGVWKTLDGDEEPVIAGIGAVVIMITMVTGLVSVAAPLFI